MGRAAEVADVSLWRFLDLLEERRVEVSYSEEDLRQDLEAVRGG